MSESLPVTPIQNVFDLPRSKDDEKVGIVTHCVPHSIIVITIVSQLPLFLLSLSIIITVIIIINLIINYYHCHHNYHIIIINHYHQS